MRLYYIILYFPLLEEKESSGLYLAGKEGVHFIPNDYHKALGGEGQAVPGMNMGTGKLRMGRFAGGKNFFAAIEPMHGNEVVIYEPMSQPRRTVVDDDVKEGHALAAADFFGSGTDQVVAGWRVPNKLGKTGIRLYSRTGPAGTQWESFWIDENGMAC